MYMVMKQERSGLGLLKKGPCGWEQMGGISGKGWRPGQIRKEFCRSQWVFEFYSKLNNMAKTENSFRQMNSSIQFFVFKLSTWTGTGVEGRGQGKCWDLELKWIRRERAKKPVWRLLQQVEGRRDIRLDQVKAVEMEKIKYLRIFSNQYNWASWHWNTHTYTQISIMLRTWSSFEGAENSLFLSSVVVLFTLYLFTL